MSPDSNKPIDRSPSEPGGAGQWLKGNLVGLGSAAVLAVYAAGFERTRAAAAKFSEAEAGRRSAEPIRTTGEIGGLAPRVAKPQPTPTPLTTTPKPEHHAVAESAPTAKSRPHVHAATPHHEKPATDTVVSRTPVSPPPAPLLDSAPAPAKSVEAPVVSVVPVAPKPAPPPTDTAQSEKEVPRKDGTYTGWGTSRHGDIQATVQIKDGKIVFAAISECLTQYSCSWIAALPPQVLARQSADVDIVSGATQSTNAFYYAVIQALNKAK